MGSSSASHRSVRVPYPIVLGFALLTACPVIIAAQTPTDPEQMLKEAISLQQAGKLDQAIAGYRLLLEKYPNVPEVRSDLGAALSAEGRYQEAIEQYQTALKLKPMPQVQLNLGLAYYKTSQLQEAVAAFQKAQEEMPGDEQPVRLQADCYLRLGENKKVIEILTPLEGEHNDDLALAYMLGTALVRDNEAAKGQVLIDKILRNGDSAEARLLLGTTKLMMNDFAGALGDLERRIRVLRCCVSGYRRPRRGKRRVRTRLEARPQQF